MKFKEGDRVRILGNTCGARLEWIKMEVGDIKVIDRINENVNVYVIDHWDFNEQDLELVVKPVKVGDVIIRDYKYVKGEYKVLEVLENTFLISELDNFEIISDNWYTFAGLEEKLKNGDWRIKGEDKEEEGICPHCNKKL